MPMNRQAFIEYCWKFYAPKEIYGRFFENKLTLKQLSAACDLRMTSPNFDGDSIDREVVRDILRLALDPNVEYRAAETTIKDWIVEVTR